MRHPHRGFTLLELLIAIAVLGLLIVLLDQGVAFGLRATATQQQAQDRHGDLETADRTIRQLLAQADPGGDEPPLFRGTADTLTLVTELPGRQRVEATLLVTGNQIHLRWVPRRHVLRSGPPPIPQDAVLATGVRALDLAYFDGTTWVTSWPGERLPGLVRATLRFTDERRRWPPIEVALVREPLTR